LISVAVTRATRPAKSAVIVPGPAPTSRSVAPSCRCGARYAAEFAIVRLLCERRTEKWCPWVYRCSITTREYPTPAVPALISWCRGAQHLHHLRGGHDRQIHNRSGGAGRTHAGEPPGGGVSPDHALADRAG